LYGNRQRSSHLGWSAFQAAFGSLALLPQPLAGKSADIGGFSMALPCFE